MGSPSAGQLSQRYCGAPGYERNERRLMDVGRRGRGPGGSRYVLVGVRRLLDLTPHLVCCNYKLNLQLRVHLVRAEDIPGLPATTY